MSRNPLEERINSASRDTKRNLCWSWWANVHYSYSSSSEQDHYTSCAVVRYYDSKVSKIELKTGQTTTFTFGYNVFPNTYTNYADDSGWGMK